MQLTAGRIVHVKSDRGECKPAIVVLVWKNMSGPGVDGFNGVVFRDGANDHGDCFGAGDDLTACVASVMAGDGFGDYHDPRECG